MTAKGIITFYINFPEKNPQEVQQLVQAFLACNKEVIERINKDGDYLVAVVPSLKEACRVEKIDFDKPYPRFLPKTHTDLARVDQRDFERRNEKDADKSSEEEKN